MRQSLLLNQDWLFKKGEIAPPAIFGHHDTYLISKAQNARGAASPHFYDKDFDTVRLPHDYVLTCAPSTDYNESQGGYFRAPAWYRRHFICPEHCEQQRFVLYFEGAGQETTVWVNGHFAGNNTSLYNSFYMDITPYLEHGGAVNTIAVQITNEKIEGWWYEGAGLYRNVHLIISDPVAIDHWGIWVNPVHTGDDAWDIPIETTLYSLHPTATEVEVRQRVLDEAGQVVASGCAAQTAAPCASAATQTLTLQNPTRWTLAAPTLYTLQTEVYCGGVCVDSITTTFGFRTLDFAPKTGFYLNGLHTKLRGTCLHQDYANLGVAVPESVLRYKLSKLKECGVNAVRLAHHNYMPALVQICDEIGLLVIDENRWFNTSDTTKKEVVSMLKRDRNHPSVFIWSLGNEEPLQNQIVGQRIVEHLKQLVKQYDTSRPCTVSLNGGFFDSFVAKASDIVAPNYFLQGYDRFPVVHPEKFVLTTESVASNNDRGIYFAPEFSKKEGIYATAYDKKRAVFGSSFRDAISAAETRPFIGGTFLWTGVDYRGEASAPKRFSASGIFDSCMFEKDSAYMCKSFWTAEPMVHIMPHWDLQGHEGEEITVFVYTNQPEAELFLNGQSLGKKACPPFAPPSWQVVYQPGCLSAITYHDGKESVRTAHTTTGAADTLHMIQQTAAPTNTGEDTVILNLHLTDAAGRFIPTASERVAVTCSDGGQILAVSNGDTMENENPRLTDRKLFSGRAQIIVRVKEGAETVSPGNLEKIVEGGTIGTLVTN